MTPELHAAAAKAKATALSRLIINAPDGSVDEAATLAAFQDLLSKEAEKINTFNQKVKPAVDELFTNNPTEFISSDNVKYTVRRSLDRSGIEATAEDITAWLEQAIKNNYLYSRRGRGGGMQLFNNALQITARYLAKNKEINEELLEEARKKMTKEASVVEGG